MFTARYGLYLCVLLDQHEVSLVCWPRSNMQEKKACLRVGRKSAITVNGKPQVYVFRGQSPRCLPAADRSVLTYIRDGLCSSTDFWLPILHVLRWYKPTAYIFSSKSTDHTALCGVYFESCRLKCVFSLVGPFDPVVTVFSKCRDFTRSFKFSTAVLVKLIGCATLSTICLNTP